MDNFLLVIFRIMTKPPRMSRFGILQKLRHIDFRIGTMFTKKELSDWEIIFCIGAEDNWKNGLIFDVVVRLGRRSRNFDRDGSICTFFNESFNYVDMTGENCMVKWCKAIIPIWNIDAEDII